jgi:hypothetical protein
LVIFAVPQGGDFLFTQQEHEKRGRFEDHERHNLWRGGVAKPVAVSPIFHRAIESSPSFGWNLAVAAEALDQRLRTWFRILLEPYASGVRAVTTRAPGFAKRPNRF